MDAEQTGFGHPVWDGDDQCSVLLAQISSVLFFFTSLKGRLWFSLPLLLLKVQKCVPPSPM